MIPGAPPEPALPSAPLANKDAPSEANVLLPAAPHAVGDLLELSSTRHVLLDGFVLYETGGSIGVASVSSPDHDIIKITDVFWKHVRERVRADHRIVPGEAPPTPQGGGESKSMRLI